MLFKRNIRLQTKYSSCYVFSGNDDGIVIDTSMKIFWKNYLLYRKYIPGHKKFYLPIGNTYKYFLKGKLIEEFKLCKLYKNGKEYLVTENLTTELGELCYFTRSLEDAMKYVEFQEKVFPKTLFHDLLTR